MYSNGQPCNRVWHSRNLARKQLQASYHSIGSVDRLGSCGQTGHVHAIAVGLHLQHPITAAESCSLP